MNEWVICKGCGLKYRPKEGFCPRCELPTEEGQVVFGSHTGPIEPPSDQSALGLAVPAGVVLALVGGFVFLGPLGGRDVGPLSLALVLGGLLVTCVGWAWSMALAFRNGVPSFLFALFVPYVSTLVMGKWQALVTKLMGAALVVLGVLFAPAGFTSSSRILEVARACDEQGAEDRAACACIGAKTVSLMSPEERSGPFAAENPQTRDLMLTAALLCRKERLVAACVANNQGSKTLCTCVVNAAVDALTPTELDNAMAQVANGLPPASWLALRTECSKKR